jgi:glycosyltransferase involved in cell wall biosynthesis
MDEFPAIRPRLASLCGTYLKPEMQSLYRQIASLRRFDNVVLAEQVQNLEQFPYDRVIALTKLRSPRPKGNFLLRFWYKYVVRQWPPPRPIHRLPPGPHFPYNLVELLKSENIHLAHVYYGHKAVKYREMLEHWGGPFLVSFHGVDVSKFGDLPSYREDLQKVFLGAELVLARSRSLLQRLEELGCPPQKLRLNHTPIPLDRFPVMERTAPTDGAWRLVQASRLIPKKGLFTTLEAMREVMQHFPKAKYILCGSGPVREEFIARRNELGLHGHVEVLGWRNQEQLLEQYRKAHIFLHPSELTDTSDQEGIPNSMLEAMATGLPVVATYHGGIPEAVTHEKDGLLVPEKSPAELAAAIIRVLSDTQLYHRLGDAAAASVRENFGLNAQVAKLEDCYLEAIALWKERRRSFGKGAAIPTG